MRVVSCGPCELLYQVSADLDSLHSFPHGLNNVKQGWYLLCHRADGKLWENVVYYSVFAHHLAQ